ncbi:hypothetical protein ACQ4PT_058049 [Festuca glaucescens]
MEAVLPHLAGKLTELLEKALVDKDEAVMSGGLRMGTKQELQELEGHINYASFLLAAGVSMRQPIDNWIGEARKTAFCLADQIAMYAIRGSSLSELYHMKYDIGMLRIAELTDMVKFHKHVSEKNGQMPAVVQRSQEGMPQLSKMPPFIRSTRSVPDDAIIRMDERMKKVEDFFAGPRSVLFITGGQGSGKTTLMKDVYASQKGKIEKVDRKGKHKLEVEQGNEPDKKDFDQCCWVDIAETGELVALLKMVLKELNVDCDSIHEFEIINMVHDNFKVKYCLMVLDNVEDTSVLYSLMKILKGLKWKIVCLTRRDIQEDVDQDVLHIPGLEPYDSFKLFLSAAFYNFHSTAVFSRENFSTIVTDGVLREAIEWKAPSLPVVELVPMVNLLNEILTRCQNNPWNIWSIGSVLEVNPLHKWKKIMEPIDGMLIDGNKLYEKCDPPVQLEDAKLADATIRHCFLYCLAFPQTSESETHENSGGIPTRKLIRLWAAEGCVENRQNPEQDAECVLEDLIKKNLLVVKKKGFDGEVLKCSVNEHIRPLAKKMCEHQKFCKVVVKDDDDASSPSRMTKCFPINPNMFIRRKKPLSDRYRMLAVHGDGGVKELSKALRKDIRLRSLLHFKTGGIEHPELELTFRDTYKLLRTLELQGANVGKLPPNIDCLVCLRYLGLRGNKLLETLPPTLQRLTHLMCLDIRDTGIQELVDVSKFEEMRHLYLTNSFRSHSVAVREGLHSLEHLQTLSGATYRKSSDKRSFEEQISHLAGCLRKLSVKKILGPSSKLFCDTINRFKHLQSLAISCDGDLKKFDLRDDDLTKFNLSDLKIGKNLRKLKLGGPMRNLFHLGDKMQSITYLYLWESTLSTDLLDTLKGLINLLVLSLVNASMSKKMICYNGYQKLKKLSIISMDELSECQFHGNSMASLEELVVAKCGNLKTPPHRLDQLRSLREVHLTGMPPEFCDKAKDKLRDKVYVLPDALSHVVPSKPATGGGT